MKIPCIVRWIDTESSGTGRRKAKRQTEGVP
jgi:hypothetical protein